ncbi:hypothetical protein BHAP_2260 [Bifidobacterium hapali]|uniref:Uncharacterized protein n=1 Tax=Bifidobacterium hapali TaxID=1630172 RepID=A0A261FNY2_9BIFI|nr:hypothetical protein BHAP_2260 [Bifidobacterium hapali]
MRGKAIISTVVAGTMILSLAACGGGVPMFLSTV